MAEVSRPRRFRRDALVREIASEHFEAIVSKTMEFLDRRFKTLAVQYQSIQDTNFNPLLLLITAPVHNLSSPFEVAERLQLGKAYHGDDTAFGRFAEEKLLPLFGTRIPPEKAQRKSAWEPIDCEIGVGGQRYLASIKSGPWTMNQSHANTMIEKFPVIHEETGANLLIGILYGRYERLNNKPKLVEDRLGNPGWFDYLVGRDFWEFATGVKDVHKVLFKAIRKAQKQFADEHKDETFHEKLVANRLKIAASLRREFNVAEEEDFWETLFNSMF